MKITYEDLLKLVNRYNSLLKENELDVLCYVSGKVMFAEDFVLSDNSVTKAFYEYIQSGSFIIELVKAAQNHKIPVFRLIKEFIEKLQGQLGNEKDTKELLRLFSQFHFVSVADKSKHKCCLMIQLLNRLNLLFRQWDDGLYAELNEQKWLNTVLVIQRIFPFESDLKELEELIEQTAKEKQIPLVYARVYCCKTKLQELMSDWIEIREYQNRFLKKNLYYLTISLNRFILQQGAKCYFEFWDYKAETFSYNAANLYHWLIATEKKMREVPKGKMTFWFSYQTYLEESKDPLLSELKMEPNMFGAAKYYAESHIEDYKFIRGILKEMKQTMAAACVNSGQPAPEAENMASSAPEDAASVPESVEFVPTAEAPEPEESEPAVPPVDTEPPASESEDKYGELLRSIHAKLDDVMSAVIEGSVITMDGLEKVNATVKTVHTDVQGVAEQIEEVKTELHTRFDELHIRLEQCVAQNNTEGLSELLEKKINLIKQLQQTDFPDVVLREDLYFLLAFLHTEKPEQAIWALFAYLKNGDYKTAYEEKISESNTILYSAESPLGKAIIYRKDGITYLKNLQIRQEYLPDNVVRFLEKYGIKDHVKIFFDDQIYEELDRLMKGTKKSFHMIMPWVKTWRLNTYEARFRTMLRSGIEIHIKYGYLSKGSDEEQNRRNEEKLVESREAVDKMNHKLDYQIRLKEDDTHIKAVVIDGKWCFVGSCNILSYDYDYKKNPDYRHEMMVLLEDEELASVLMKYCEGTIHDVK